MKTQKPPQDFVVQSQHRLRHASRLANQRRGAAAVFGLFLTLGLVAMMAISIDFGYIHVAETELSRTADAAAMAGCWEMFDQQVANQPEHVISEEVVNAASQFASHNSVANSQPELFGNDVELGFFGSDQSWNTSDPSIFNAVRVLVRRNSDANGDLALFLGSITGLDSQSMETSATAAMLHSISGFDPPSDDGKTINLFPFALDLPTWLLAINGESYDSFCFSNGLVSSGADGLHEVNLYPKGTGAPGNRGTVDIGSANNSTADLSRQILFGVSAQDFVELGKPLQFNENGILELNGDTGISAGVKDELESIIGETRIIPIYTEVTGNGNNAMFTIVRWEGVRILDVKLTGKKDQKRLIIQPAKVIARGSIVDPTGTAESSYLSTPVMLVQ